MKTKSQLKKEIQRQNELIASFEISCKHNELKLYQHRKALDDLWHLVEAVNLLYDSPETNALLNASSKIYNSTSPF